MLDLDASRIYSCSILPELPGCAGFQPAPGATSGLLNQEEAMDATPACMMMWFSAFPRLLPLIPPVPFSHTGRRGRLGVLMPETENGTQGLPQKPHPVSLRASDAKPACAERELQR